MTNPTRPIFTAGKQEEPTISCACRDVLHIDTSKCRNVWESYQDGYGRLYSPSRKMQQEEPTKIYRATCPNTGSVIEAYKKYDSGVFCGEDECRNRQTRPVLNFEPYEPTKADAEWRVNWQALAADKLQRNGISPKQTAIVITLLENIVAHGIAAAKAHKEEAKPTKADAWVEEALQEYDTFHLDGKYFHKTPKQIRDWLRTALTTLLAEKEKEQAVIAVSNAKLGGLWDIAQADMVKKILSKIDAHQKSLRYENFKGRLDYELGLEKAIDIIKISNS